MNSHTGALYYFGSVVPSIRLGYEKNSSGVIYMSADRHRNTNVAAYVNEVNWKLLFECFPTNHRDQAFSKSIRNY